MTKAEAEQRCRELAEAHPDRSGVRWLPRESDRGWTALPDGLARGPLRPVVEAKPRPPQADDPRPAHIRNVPGGWG